MRILVVTPYAGWTWFGHDFGDSDCSWEFENLSLYGKKPWVWFSRACRVARESRDRDLIISHHPHMSFYLAAALKLMGIQKPHYAFSFNHGNGRFFRGPMRAVAVSLFKGLRGVVVFSDRERRIYSDYYGIPYEKLSFVHWAVNPPDVGGEVPQYLLSAGRYVCCIGRNNRDFELFLEVARDLGIPSIVVCDAGRLRPEQIPANVLVRCDVPEKEAMQILARAAISVVPLKDASRGAGHMTVVSAMHLGVPQVLTRLPTVSDYFEDGVHGLFVEPNSRASLRDALSRLWGNPEERVDMARAAREFSAEWLDESASRRHLLAYLKAVREGRTPPTHPPGWSRVSA